MFDDYLIHRYTHTFSHQPGCYWCGLPPAEQVDEWLRSSQPPDPGAPFRVIEQVGLSDARAL